MVVQIKEIYTSSSDYQDKVNSWLRSNHYNKIKNIKYVFIKGFVRIIIQYDCGGSSSYSNSFLTEELKFRNEDLEIENNQLKKEVRDLEIKIRGLKCDLAQNQIIIDEYRSSNYHKMVESSDITEEQINRLTSEIE